jgi:hypothetical protein
MWAIQEFRSFIRHPENWAIMAGALCCLWLLLVAIRRPGCGANAWCGWCGYWIAPKTPMRCSECGSDLTRVGVMTPWLRWRMLSPTWVVAAALAVLFFCAYELLCGTLSHYEWPDWLLSRRTSTEVSFDIEDRDSKSSVNFAFYTKRDSTGLVTEGSLNVSARYRPDGPRFPTGRLAVWLPGDTSVLTVSTAANVRPFTKQFEAGDAAAIHEFVTLALAPQTEGSERKWRSVLDKLRTCSVEQLAQFASIEQVVAAEPGFQVKLYRSNQAPNPVLPVLGWTDQRAVNGAVAGLLILAYPVALAGIIRRRRRPVAAPS